MRLTRRVIFSLISLDPTTNQPTPGQVTLTDTALRYQKAADAAWKANDLKLFRQMEKESRTIFEELGVFKTKRIEEKKNLKQHFQKQSKNIKKNNVDKRSRKVKSETRTIS